MADTSQHELSEPHTNGVIDGLTEEEKSKMRPADIDAVSIELLHVVILILQENSLKIILFFHMLEKLLY